MCDNPHTLRGRSGFWKLGQFTHSAAFVPRSMSNIVADLYGREAIMCLSHVQCRVHTIAAVFFSEQTRSLYHCHGISRAAVVGAGLMAGKTIQRNGQANGSDMVDSKGICIKE